MDVDGEWINQNGSILEIKVGESGEISGWYCSRKGRAASGKRYPLSGVKSDELLAFHVNWKDDAQDIHAITSFTGRCVESPEPAIHTMWILARQYEDVEQTRPTGAWNAFLTNADVFVRRDVR
ncbi:MAG: hypothetical protein KDI19_13725 [Pseudomonadales bacterium]|nr:hypothetical protein [Pseudomonadales bacterium]